MKKNKHLMYRIYRKKNIIRIQNKMRLLGTNLKYDEATFLNTRMILTIILFLLLLLFSNHGYILAPIFAIVFYLICEYIVLDIPIKKRGIALEEEAIFFFEVLLLTLDSSKNLKSALELTTQNIKSELSSEFQKMLEEIKLGKSFTESLEAMKARIPSDTIKNIILNLTESSIFGNSITESLNNQLDYLRDKKMFEIKAEISKLPTKISILSVIFFIPIMLLIILAPVLVEFLIG